MLGLGPGEVREVCWTVWSSQRPAPGSGRDEVTGKSELDALFPAIPRVSGDEGAAAYHAWERGTASVVSDHELFNLVLKRSVSDLRLPVNEGPGPEERYVAAGVPWFTTLFGRDSIITALQMLAFRPQLAFETLGVLAARQAIEVDDERDPPAGRP
jgi:glycogen debranching enzyme